MDHAATTPASGVLEALRDLPIGTHLAVGGGLLAGLMLWIYGRRVMKPAFAVVGVALGGFIGLLLTPVLGLPAIGPVQPPYVGLGAGAVAGLVVAAMLFRFLMGAAAGVVMAVAGVLAAAAWIDSQPEGAGGPPASAAIIDQLGGPVGGPAGGPAGGLLGGPGEPGAGDSPQGTNSGGMTLEESAQTLLERTRVFVSAASARLREVWAATPARERAILVGGGVLGALAGVLVGMVLPKRAAAIVSAPLGAAVWMPSAAWLAHAVGVPGVEHLPQSPMRWLVVWVVVSAAGAAAQLVGLRRGRKRGE